jgi:hypothetical protein
MPEPEASISIESYYAVGARRGRCGAGRAVGKQRMRGKVDDGVHVGKVCADRELGAVPCLKLYLEVGLGLQRGEE